MARLSDRPPPPPGSPLPPPPPRPQLPPAPPTLQQRAWAGLALAVLSLLTLALMGNIQRGVYVVTVALAVAVVALVLAISAMLGASRAGTRRPRGALTGTVIGAVGFVFSGFVLAVFLIFWSQLNQYATCMDGAGTVATQQACQQQFNDSVSAEINVLSGK